MSRAPTQLDNRRIAAMFEQTADLLDRQGENAFRVGSYRRAAESVRSAERPVGEILDAGGVDALQARCPASASGSPHRSARSSTPAGSACWSGSRPR